MRETQPLLAVEGLRKSFRAEGENRLFHHQRLVAVENVSFAIAPGETFGLVGESGCGKSTVAKLLMGLEKPDAGAITLAGQRLDQLSERQRRPLRTKMQMVFQDSGSSLNPRKRIAEILREPMVYHGIVTGKAAEERVTELLAQVGLTAEMAARYPHELSGGQRQRVCIARALSLNPALLVLDEPVSALDVSVQAQILNLLKDLQAALGLSYLFIGHGLGAVRYISHRIGVMYMGRLVETGDAEQLFAQPVHPYTQALIDAAPVADYALRNRPRITLTGEIGSLGEQQKGCPFAARCPKAKLDCLEQRPVLKPLQNDPSRCVACLLSEQP